MLSSLDSATSPENKFIHDLCLKEQYYHHISRLQAEFLNAHTHTHTLVYSISTLIRAFLLKI